MVTKGVIAKVILVLEISKSSCLSFSFFLLETTCIPQFSEIQAEVMNPLGFPNEQDISTILLSQPYHACFYFQNTSAFLNAGFIGRLDWTLY